MAKDKWTNPEQGWGLEGRKYPVCSGKGASASKVFDVVIRTTPTGRLISMNCVSYGLNDPSEVMVKSNCHCDIKKWDFKLGLESSGLMNEAVMMRKNKWPQKGISSPERLGPSSGTSTALLDFTTSATIICINVYGLQRPSLWRYVMATEKAIEQYFLGKTCLLRISIPFGTWLCSPESLQVSQVYRSKCAHCWSFLPWFPSMSFKVCLIVSRL